ncbi:hypothetical protein BU24DRAFT_421322 [Aaosphaeria arxii CBS 175.79]|uniref:Ribosome assembly protein 3 n=1 Tax=Aaosphaeria arxii CBS 175.79 TaxID=1450172 RepID=A0A6A5XYG6_9PLEO|nr:uncharacterized protein BU24DRAFT_421322 [Aaosphaeria arxii CBS 175.79]KAF2018338.1 hypothetical protein BU24DRAFT_421322 [Aaosphaeria arxii CBS 175.79]
MARLDQSNVTEKRKRSRKKKSRLEVSSSSESESEVEQRQRKKSTTKAIVTEESNPQETIKKARKKKNAVTQVDEDASMLDAEEPSHDVSAEQKSRPSQPDEDFTSIYLRKITAELGDDLNKVREAQDFTAKSLPMLIHALKQGESIFSTEEKKRVVGAVNA